MSFLHHHFLKISQENHHSRARRAPLLSQKEIENDGNLFHPPQPPFNGDGSELVCTTSSTALTVFVEVKRAALNIKFLHYFCHIARLFTLRLDSFSGDKNVQAITIGNGGCRAHTVNPKEWRTVFKSFHGRRLLMHFRLDELQFSPRIVPYRMREKEVCSSGFMCTHVRHVRAHLLTLLEEKSFSRWMGWKSSPNTPNPIVVCHVHKSLLMRCLLCHLLLVSESDWTDFQKGVRRRRKTVINACLTS